MGVRKITNTVKLSPTELKFQFVWWEFHVCEQGAYPVEYRHQG